MELLKLTIDPTKKPKTMDIAVTGAPGDTRGNYTIQAIYELDGDTLRMCGGPKRPAEFKTTADTGDTELFVLKREKR